MFSKNTLSNKSDYAQYAVRELFPVAEKIEASGQEVVRVNVGDSVAYFPTPRYVIEAYKKALEEGKTNYGRSPGERVLLDAVVRRYKRKYGLEYKSDDVMVTQGLSEAIAFINKALMSEGRGGVLLNPFYPSYKPWIHLEGGTPVLAECNEEEGWEPDIDSLEKGIKEAEEKNIDLKYLLVINPNNPTGAVVGRKRLIELAEVAKNHDLLLISDEIYDQIVFQEGFASIGELAKGQPHIIMNGVSKVWGGTGFRIGWIIVPEGDAASKAFKDAFTRLGTLRLCPQQPAQYAAAAALDGVAEHEKYLKGMNAKIKAQSLHACKRLNEIEGVNCATAKGAFYVFPRIDLAKAKCKTDVEFIRRLLEKQHVWAVQGSGFGSPGHIRMVTLPNTVTLDKAIDGVAAMMK